MSRKFTKEHREKIAAALRGKKHTPERIANMAKGRTGVIHKKKRLPLSEESKRNISNGRKGKGMGPRNGKWNPDREAVHMNVHMQRMHQAMLGRTLLWTSKKKTESKIKELGYTQLELKEHLESQFVEGMNWDNHGRGGWHIDHIRPISSFPKDTLPKVISSLSNLKPLWEHENLSKGSKWDSNDEQ